MRANQAGIWTALPAVVKSFNAAALTVEAQPAIQAQVHQPDGTWLDVNISLCVDCPVMYPGGGGFAFTFPLSANDEGLLVFSSRCIDSWWQSGGVQKQADLRMHDLSDGFFLPTGGMSQPNIPGNVNTTALQIRTKDGKNLVHLDSSTIVLSLNNGEEVVTLDHGAKKISLVIGAASVTVDSNAQKISLVSGATELDVDNVAQKVSVTAVLGLWVNGVRVTVP